MCIPHNLCPYFPLQRFIFFVFAFFYENYFMKMLS